MLRFEAFVEGKQAEDIDLAGAYVFAQDEIPIRADLVASGNEISCMKQSPGACGLMLLWPSGPAGKYLMGTTRLPKRSKPYNLNLELARAQIMRLYRKREDWALFDYADTGDLNQEFDQIRRQFVEAMCTDVSDPAAAAIIADKVLNQALLLGEKMALFHADLLYQKRTRRAKTDMKFGTAVNLYTDQPAYRDLLAKEFDFVHIPTHWCHTEAQERVHEYSHIDEWINWATRENKAIHAGPLLCFEPNVLPEWLTVWKNDFDALRKLVYAHIQRLVERYASRVKVWNVTSGLAAVNTFNLSFDQISELTRTSCQLVKKMAPDSQVMIDITMPWGEYYARNQRTIPPLLYADMAYQADMKFDAFGLSLQMGIPTDGHFVRDLMQISGMLDMFIPHGKAVHITACSVPSSPQSDPADFWGGRMPVAKAGAWHAPWSERLQAEWMQAVVRLARSKPYVESICWGDLADIPRHRIPNGGLCKANLHPKTAYKEFLSLRHSMVEDEHHNHHHHRHRHH
ncbi:MAG: endo-1,4-beta-xylanase [Phycisphaerae bacterium]|nr:endo-1,4-beta-xylanase [Phycisphaerae bacterium]